MAGARLTGTVKHYDWGGFSFIPSLLNVSNPDKKPFAEYWMGVHPQAGCRIEIDNTSYGLPDYIQQNRPSVLGAYVDQHFGNIPYLFKTLDVRDMLSIQVHPSKAEAEKDFARENEAGIPLDSPERNYKDANHKPELLVAVGEFWLLHGFKPEPILRKTLAAVPELASLLPVYDEAGYKGLYSHVMQMPQEAVNAQLKPLLDRIIPLYQAGKLEKSSEDYWAAKGALTFSQPGKTDRGLFSIYFFNLVHLDRGEAVFQDAGVPHAYLEGQNIEIMSSSDNVLRGGLTTKHIDVKELLKHVKCEATQPRILKGEISGDAVLYKTSAPDFELSSFSVKQGATASFTPVTAEILLLTDGEATVSPGIVLKKGAPSMIVFPGDKVQIEAMQNCVIFRASVPIPG